jgi:OOP family OmpA-OmpF porin
MRLALLLTLFASTALADRVFIYKLSGNELRLPYALAYETGKDTLKDADDAIVYVKSYLADKSDVSLLRIEVHSDTDGDAKANQTLSEKRALAVAKALAGKGADCKRLLPVGFGSTKPIASNATAEGRAQNRRTSFVNAALRGKPIDGPVDGRGAVAGDPCK